MILLFEDRRPLFAVLDRQIAWGAFLAARIMANLHAHGKEIAIRHVDILEALDSCLIDSQIPVGVLVADDFTQLPELASFVTRHSQRPDTFVVVASHRPSAEAGWLLRECGAHFLVRKMEDVIAVLGPLQRFFERAVAGRW
jgi:hypothetical protein